VYEMVTGARAFQSGSQAALIGAILRDDPQPLGELAPEVPASLAHNRPLSGEGPRGAMADGQRPALSVALDQAPGDGGADGPWRPGRAGTRRASARTGALGDGRHCRGVGVDRQDRALVAQPGRGPREPCWRQGASSTAPASPPMAAASPSRSTPAAAAMSGSTNPGRYGRSRARGWRRAPRPPAHPPRPRTWRHRRA
jgi:hypothetical protein